MKKGKRVKSTKKEMIEENIGNNEINDGEDYEFSIEEIHELERFIWQTNAQKSKGHILINICHYDCSKKDKHYEDFQNPWDREISISICANKDGRKEVKKILSKCYKNEKTLDEAIEALIDSNNYEIIVTKML